MPDPNSSYSQNPTQPPPPTPSEVNQTPPPIPTPVSVVPQATPQSTQPSPKSPNKIIIGLIIFVVVCLSLGLALFLLFSKPSQPVEKVTSVSPSQTQTKNINRQYNPETLTNYTKEELTNMGIITLPEGFSIQEEYKGIKFTKSPKRSFTANELALLHRFLDQTPARLLTPGPAAIVTYGKDELDTGAFGTGLSTVAFASGNYLFFNEDSFKSGTLGVLLGDTSVDGAFYAFEHELTHVTQFNETALEIENILSSNTQGKRLSWLDASMKANFYKDFANIAGWKQTTDEYGYPAYELINKDSELTTDYGKTKIYEDMAETVAGIIVTRDYEFSSERKAWALKFLGEDYEKLKPGKFPYSNLYQPTKAFFTKHDFTKEDQYKAKYPFVDKQVFSTDKQNSLEEVKQYLEKELISRGWNGTFNKTVKDDGVEIYKADFIGNDRDMYLELQSYDKAQGYEEKPAGTIVIVFSGYTF